MNTEIATLLRLNSLNPYCEYCKKCKIFSSSSKDYDVAKNASL